MLEWVVFVGVLFLTGWLLRIFAAKPILLAPAPTASAPTASAPTASAPTASAPTASAPTASAPTAVLALALAQAPAPDLDIRAYKPESWCFVGENTLGRFCVKSDICQAQHKYPSREACEYTEASALPLGVAREDGLTYTPFMTPRDMRYTTF